jgi:voltage-gated sodium channel
MSEAVANVPQRSPLERFVEHELFKRAIIGLIIINAALLGVETMRELPAGFLDAVFRVNRIILGVFVIEVALRIVVYRVRFFKDPWSIFDFVIVAIALAAPSGPLQVMRALRILRALRLVSAITSLRRVVDGLLGAVPGIASVMFLLVFVLYIAAVIATLLYRDIAPENFGHLGISLFSLFQIMTLEGWSDIATRIMAVQPWAWIFFIGYILLATFLVLNLVIGVVVSSIQSRIEAESEDRVIIDPTLKDELVELRSEINKLRESLNK